MKNGYWIGQIKNLKSENSPVSESENQSEPTVSGNPEFVTQGFRSGHAHYAPSVEGIKPHMTPADVFFKVYEINPAILVCEEEVVCENMFGDN